MTSSQTAYFDLNYDFEMLQVEINVLEINEKK